MDDEIRAALTALAERAPDADPVRHRVAVRAKTLRQRRAVLAVAGAVAVGATVPLAASRLARGSAPITPASPGRAPGPSGSALPGSPVAAWPADPAAAGGNIRIPLRYRAAWLPAGFAENSRTASVTGPSPGLQVRGWSSKDYWTDAVPFVQVALLPRDGADVSHVWPELPGRWTPAVFPPRSAPRQEVRVGDRHGTAWPTPTGWVVEWRDGDGSPLAVQTGNMAESLATALRVAEAVVPDGNAAVECALQLTWLPDGLARAPQYVQTTSDVGSGWGHQLSLAEDRLRVSFRPDYHLSMVESTVDGRPIPPPDTIAFPFRGRPGNLWLHHGPKRYDSDHVFDVQLAGGRGLFVLGRAVTMDEGDFRRLITGVRVGSVPYVDWIGRR